MNQRDPRQQIPLALCLMLVAVLCFSLLNAAGKYLSIEYAVVQVVWARYVFALALLLISFAPRRGFALFKTARPGQQLLRGSLQVGSSVLFFIGVASMPLTTAATITATGPLMLTALSVPLLGEQVGIRRWAAVAIGFLGALIVIRPGGEGASWWSMFFVASTLCSVFYQILTRRLGFSENADTSATITALVGAITASLAIGFFWTTPATAFDWALFVGVGALAGFGHYLLTLAFQRAPASAIAPFNYTHIVWAALLGYLVFEQLPDRWTVAGASIIVGAGLYVAHREAVRARQK